MSFRRAVLLLGLVLLGFTAARRVDAGTDVDVEAGGYGGTESGGWSCGPTARAKYAGVGAGVRVRYDVGPERNGEHDKGVFEGAGAVEQRSYTLLDCRNDPCKPKDTIMPSPTVMGAVSAKGGYDSRWIGFRLGAIVQDYYDKNDDRLPSARIWPDLSLRVGSLDSLRGEIGLGSYSAPTLHRAGLYGGLAYSPARHWDIALHGGIHQTFDSDGGFRGDVALRAPLSDDVQVGAGLALSEGVRMGPEPEGRVFLNASF